MFGFLLTYVLFCCCVVFVVLCLVLFFLFCFCFVVVVSFVVVFLCFVFVSCFFVFVFVSLSCLFFLAGSLEVLTSDSVGPCPKSITWLRHSEIYVLDQGQATRLVH